MRVARGFLMVSYTPEGVQAIGGFTVVLTALVAPPVLPAAQSDTTKLRTAVVVPTVEKTPEPSPKANKTIEGPASKTGHQPAVSRKPAVTECCSRCRG
jgi:hypothetical protein